MNMATSHDSHLHAPRNPASPEIETLLTQALHELDRGNVQLARRLGDQAQSIADIKNNMLGTAQALAVQAQVDRITANFAHACDQSYRAAHLFQLLNDPSGEAAALTTTAHAASCLGRNEEAVEAALLSVRLGELGKPSMQLALSYNYLGLAYFWSMSFEMAHAAFDAAEMIAKQCDPKVNILLLQLNRSMADVVCIAADRYQVGIMPRANELRGLRRHYPEPCLGPTRLGLPGGLLTLEAAGLMLRGFELTWSGKTDVAERALAQTLQVLARYDSNSWLHSLAQWLKTEIAWARQDLIKAARCAEKMIELASQIEHEQLACVGHMLATQLYELHGDYQLAIQEQKRWRAREQRIRAQTLGARARVVQWRLEARESKRHLGAMEASSKRFERLSLEDPLTGLANRRCFEQTLIYQLATPDALPLGVALIDVNEFKLINDLLSHVVGDEVLKLIAEQLQANAGEHAMAARLAGDEFVILFDTESLPQATTICQNMCNAVANANWDSVASGLQVSVSLGLAFSEAGDTRSTLLRRADQAMYANKTKSKLGRVG